MDREQHIKQDAAEHYAVFVMASAAVDLGCAQHDQRDELWGGFMAYLERSQWTLADFENLYPQYQINVDSQVPRFVNRLARLFDGAKFSFEIDEAAFRNRGLKADFVLQVSGRAEPHFVSLKNYLGKGGIQTPQVSSGTLFSFAAGFVFERVGVGTFVDPANPKKVFAARNQTARDAALVYMGLRGLIKPLQDLQELSGYVKTQLLTPELRMYDREKVKEVVAVVSDRGRAAILEVFDQLGPDVVRAKLLERAGLDGTEEVLYFDSQNFIDSITQPAYHDLRLKINQPDTRFVVAPRGNGLSFEFSRGGVSILSVNVPLTVNTNGAWHRPKERYEGLARVKDVNAYFDLAWGQVRPNKSRQIDTSTNTYVDLRKAGILAL